MILSATVDVLKTGMPVIERHVDYNQIVISVVSFIVVSLIIVIKLLFKGYFSNLFISVFRPDSSLVKSTESGTGLQASVLAGVAAILSVSATIMSVLVYYKIPLQLELSPVLFFIICVVLTIAYYVFYKISLQIIGVVIDIREHTAVYSRLKSDLFKIMSLFLLPLFLIFPYADIWMYKPIVLSVFIITILIFLINTGSFFSYLVKIKFLNHYAILYFCILEILPLLIVAKLIGI